MKRKIFLDFDGTLFDTSALKKEMFALYKSVGFGAEEITKHYRLEAKDGLFSPYGLLDRLTRGDSKEKSRICKSLAALLLTSDKYVYPDTIPYLSVLDREKFEINLMTLGDIRFQSTKVEHSGMKKYFDNLYYVDKAKWEIFDQYASFDEPFMFIDDREDTVYNIEARFPKSICLCIKRTDEDKDDLHHHPISGKIKVIKNLNESFTYLDHINAGTT